MPYPASASVPNRATRPVRISTVSTICSGENAATAPTLRMSKNMSPLSLAPPNLSVSRADPERRNHSRNSAPSVVETTCPKATPKRPKRGIGPSPRPRLPPNMICTAEAESSVSDGTLMLPVPRTIEANVLRSQIEVAPMNTVLE
jgi:hypothetical protein